MGAAERLVRVLVAGAVLLCAVRGQAEPVPPPSEPPSEASATLTPACPAQDAPAPEPAGSESASASPAAPERSPLATLPKLALDDAVYVLGSPFRWTGKDWAIAGGAAGLIVVSALADVSARNAVRTHSNGALDELTRIVEPFGAEYSWGVLGAFGVVALVFHDADARDTAIDGVLASALASGIITPSLKFAVGRARPNQSDDSLSFHPFQSGFSSFPSGHTTQAFAVASVISAHSDRFWVSASAYTLASLVAFARVYHNAHWTSDTVAGALIGTAVGRGVVALNRRIRSGDHSIRLVLAPMVGPSTRGAGATVIF